MFLGCSGTTSLGGKWLFFISFRCDGVLGPLARGAPAPSYGAKRSQPSPGESAGRLWVWMGLSTPIYLFCLPSMLILPTRASRAKRQRDANCVHKQC